MRSNVYISTDHASSNLLYEDENNTLHRLIGSKAECLCMAVIQLFFTRPPTHAQWFKESTGVLCLIKDNVRREFVLKIYNMDSSYYTVIFEEDLQAYMDYREDNNFFHTFQSDHKIVAFNFANNYEASTMNTKIQEKIQWLRQRLQNQMNPLPHINSASPREPSEMSYRNQNNMTMMQAIKTSSGNKKRRFTKNDIGLPQDFVHTLHYGIDMQKNFSLEDCPTELKAILRTVNITDHQLQNPEVREVIRNTLDHHQMQNANENHRPSNNVQMEIEREENYMVTYKSTKTVPTRPPKQNNQSQPIDVHNEIVREDNYMTRYKSQHSVSSSHQVTQEMSLPPPIIRRSSTSGEVGLQIGVDPNELFSAINNRRRSKEAGAKLPTRQPTLKNEHRPLALPQRKDSLAKHKPKTSTSTNTPSVMGRPLPPIPIQLNNNEIKRKPSQLHGGFKRDSPRAPPPPTPLKSSSKGSSASSSSMPPPTPNFPSPPPPPPPLSYPLLDNIANSPDNSDGRSALFDSIKKGTNLKAPDLMQPAKNVGTSRNDLLSEIRMGRQLNPVQARNPNIEIANAEELSPHGNDLATALSRALKIRSNAIQSDDDTDDETGESEDEWDA